MSERYTRLFSLPGNLYAEGAPVAVVAGALLKDNQTGKVLAQLKLKSISAKEIRVAKVKVVPHDTVNKPLDGISHHEYLDLHVSRDQEFGQKEAIVLPNISTRGFSVSVTEVYFSDNSIWSGTDAPWEILPEPISLEKILGEAELYKQYKLHYGADCQTALMEVKDLWICVCGAVNHIHEKTCHTCGKRIGTLKNIDLTALKEERDARLKAEQLQAMEKRLEELRLAEEKKSMAEAQKHKTVNILKKFTLVICTLAAIMAIIAAIAHYVSPLSTEYNETVSLVKYNNAVSLMEAEQYEEAIVAFEALDGYLDSNQQIKDCKAAILEAQYSAAASLISAGQYAEASMAFRALGDYQDARELSAELWNFTAVCETISAGGNHTVGLKSDGTVVAVGQNKDGQCDVNDWADIIAISAGYRHTVGLKSDGTVVATGWNDSGQCDVSDWTDIVAISAKASRTLGLKSDGTVVTAGWNVYGQWDVSDWTDIVAVSEGTRHMVGLKSDGTVVGVGKNNEDGRFGVSTWTDIVAVSAGHLHTVGLKADGTVVAIGNNEFGQCNVNSWTDIVAISAGEYHTLGLKFDGTVVAVGKNDFGPCDVNGWSDIKLPN